jgi:hypothetical protein
LNEGLYLIGSRLGAQAQIERDVVHIVGNRQKPRPSRGLLLANGMTGG